jgi:hypothetical protein
MSGSRQVAIEAGVEQALAGFQLPEQLGFGVTMIPMMYCVEATDGVWGQGRLMPYGPIMRRCSVPNVMRPVSPPRHGGSACQRCPRRCSWKASAR